MLSNDHKQEFRENGFTVIENVLSETEVQTTREKLHSTIHLRSGHTHNQILVDPTLIGKRIKGPASYISYAKWKLLDINCHPNIVKIYGDLLRNTFKKNTPLFPNPYEDFDNFMIKVDRVCYRLPNEDGLGLHIDRNPVTPFYPQLKTWRPIQGFVCLTDHYSNQCGGIQVIPGFHKNIDNYFKGNDDAEKVRDVPGNFFRMNGKRYVSLQKKLQSVYAPRGSMVLWDNRLAHATTPTLCTGDSREVIYLSFLPNIAKNIDYVEEQARDIIKNVYPEHSHHTGDADRDWEISSLNEQQRNLLLL